MKIKSLILELRRDFDDNLKEQIVEVIWKRCNSKHEYDSKLKEYVCTVDNLLTYLKKFIRGFKRKIIDRLRNFQSQVIEYEKRYEKYMDLNERLLDMEIHYPDNCIILDAHDISLNDNLDLEFVTADNNMIINANNILNLLNIQKFHSMMMKFILKHLKMEILGLV